MIVVCAPGQELPPLPAWIELVHDEQPGLGPLAGLAAGLSAAAAQAALAVVCAVDAPLAHPEVFAALLAELGDAPAAVPHSEGRAQPLFAAYRSELGALAGELLIAGERRAAALGERAGALAVERSGLLAHSGVAAFDPELASLLSLDDSEAYARALAAPEPLVSVIGAAGPRELRASSVGRARELLGGPCAPMLPALVPVDDETPLFAGDVLAGT